MQRIALNSYRHTSVLLLPLLLKTSPKYICQRHFSTTALKIAQRPFLNTSYENSCLKRDFESFKSSKSLAVANALVDRYLFLEQREKNPTERYKDGFTLWTELTQSHTTLPPSIFTKLVNLFLLCGKKDLLLVLIDSMIQQQMIPEKICLEPIVFACLENLPYLEKFTSYVIEKEIRLDNALLYEKMLRTLISKNLDFENFATYLEEFQNVDIQDVFLRGIRLMNATALNKLYTYLQTKGEDNIDPDLVGAILTQYFHVGHGQTALDMFRNTVDPVVTMWHSVLKNLNPVTQSSQIYDLFYENREREDYYLDEKSALTVFKACTKLSINAALQVHQFILLQEEDIERNIAPDLIALYSSFGESPFLTHAVKGIFARGPSNSYYIIQSMKNLVTQNKYEEALRLFKIFTDVVDVYKEDNAYSLILALYAAGEMGDLLTGEIIRSALKSHPPFYRSKEYHHALSLMYAKSGDISKAFRVWFHIESPTVEDWNVFLRICGMNVFGLMEEYFSQMMESSIMPDEHTILVMMKYSPNPRFYFDKLKHFRLKPSVSHYKELVGKFETLEKNLNIIHSFETKYPDIESHILYNSLFKSLVKRNMFNDALQIMKSGKITAEEKEQPEIYWKFALWLKAEGKLEQEDETFRPFLEFYKESRKNRKAWTYIVSKKHTFYMFDQSHEHSSSIYEDIVRYLPIMKRHGYVERTELLEDVEPYPSNLPAMGRYPEVLTFLFANDIIPLSDYVLIMSDHLLEGEAMEILSHLSRLARREIRISDPVKIYKILPDKGSNTFAAADDFSFLFDGLLQGISK